MKKLYALITVLLMVGFTLAQNNLDIDQSGNSAYWGSGLVNAASASQVGSGIDGDFDQTAGTWNKLTTTQGGTNLDITLAGNAGTSNNADFKQSGQNSHIYISQDATDESNYLQTWQQSGLGYTADNNNIDVEQTAITTNYLNQRQSGQNHIVNLVQDAGTYNHAETYQGQWGALETDNILVGATLGTWGPLFDYSAPATQTSTTNYNELVLDQNGSFNEVGLYQDGFDYNYANIFQADGNNSLLIHQTNADGFNFLNASQTGGHNSAVVEQNTYTGGGTINVNQN